MMLGGRVEEMGEWIVRYLQKVTEMLLWEVLLFLP